MLESETIGTFPPVNTYRLSDTTALTSNDGFVPDSANDMEAAFSRFQTLTIQFKDTLTSTANLTTSSSTKDYSIEVTAMPLLGEIQDFVSSRDTRSVAGDILIKAPIPCILGLSITIQIPPGSPTPNSANIANDLSNFVNDYGFRGQLPSSSLLDVIHNHLEPGSAVTAFDMLGKLHYPDGTYQWLHDERLLQIPYEPALFVTNRTALFMLTPEAVAIDVVTADILSII